MTILSGLAGTREVSGGGVCATKSCWSIAPRTASWSSSAIRTASPSDACLDFVRFRALSLSVITLRLGPAAFVVIEEGEICRADVSTVLVIGLSEVECTSLDPLDRDGGGGG